MKYTNKSLFKKVDNTIQELLSIMTIEELVIKITISKELETPLKFIFFNRMRKLDLIDIEFNDIETF